MVDQSVNVVLADPSDLTGLTRSRAVIVCEKWETEMKTYAITSISCSSVARKLIFDTAELCLIDFVEELRLLCITLKINQFIEISQLGDFKTLMCIMKWITCSDVSKNFHIKRNRMVCHGAASGISLNLWLEWNLRSLCKILQLASVYFSPYTSHIFNKVCTCVHLCRLIDKANENWGHLNGSTFF